MNLKTVFIGDQGVGKTTVCKSIIQNKNCYPQDISTMLYNTEFIRRNHVKTGDEYGITLIDHGGSARNMAIWELNLKHCDIVMAVISLKTNYMYQLEKILDCLTRVSLYDHTVILFILNKSDLADKSVNKIEKECVEKVVESEIPYKFYQMVVSFKDDQNVDKLLTTFCEVVDNIVDKKLVGKTVDETVVKLDEPVDKPVNKKSSCF